jgi:hypothetical protein
MLAVSLSSSASAQNFPGAAYQGYAPVFVNDAAIADPYATVTAAPNTWSLGNVIAFPTVESFRDRLWMRLEWLYWGTEGMDLPPLVTTTSQPIPQSLAGVLGEDGTRLLFGGGEINGGSVSGARFRSGFWMRQGACGIETEWFGLGNQNDGFFASSDGATVLARPFFDILGGQETALLLSHPDGFSGGVAITSKSDLRSFMIAGRRSLVPVCGVCVDPCDPADRVDWLLGYRQLELRDQLNFAQRVSIPDQTNAVAEAFRTKNRFQGLQLGFIYQANFRRAWLESLLRVAIGQNRQSVDIFGGTAITRSDGTDNFNGGFLVQRTNGGSFRRKEFAMIPEVGFNLGIRLTRCMHATIGYSLLYFPSVVRPGDQISRDLNPNLFAPEADPFAGALRPRFRFVESDYWAHGLNLGAELAF